MRLCILLLIGISFTGKLVGQKGEIITLTPTDVETIFLTQNLELIAEKLNIPIAEAAVVQSKLWDNPNLSVTNVNLWSTSSQRGGEREVIPPLFGSFGRNTEFSIELSQLILTANKRAKLVGMENLSKEMTIRQFEEVLRGLKTELRKTIHEFLYLNAYDRILRSQTESVSQLIESYKRQVIQGNLSKHELLRLQSALFEIENEQNETRIELNRQEKIIKSVLNMKPESRIVITEEGLIYNINREFMLGDLIQIATETRPDLQQKELEFRYLKKSLAYEKAKRIPDLTFSANYDRYGGVWKDFIGFGFSMDLPFFNRNQGNIKVARIRLDQGEYFLKQKQNDLKLEIAEALNNYQVIWELFDKIQKNPLLQELDTMLDAYTRSLLNRNISMLEYIDFMDTYRNNKQTWLNARKNLFLQFEELQYAVGKDIPH